MTVEGIIQKVSDASGAKYSSPSPQLTGSAPEPPVSSKPVFTPLRTGKVSAGTESTFSLPMKAKPNDDDGWGPDAPPVTRTNLEKVKSAYQPTRVNMQELKSGKQPEPTVESSNTAALQDAGVVKGGYQPVGKVDIAAIRRKAREAGDPDNDRPEPVKGVYEPVGKIDISAIRARAQNTGDSMENAEQSRPPFDGQPTSTGNHDSHQSNRLTSLPKPKVSNKLGGSSTFTGTKPPLPGGSPSSATPLAPVGSASRTFANQGGKTPAQIWAEKKAKERGQEPSASTAAPENTTPAAQTQHSGGDEWKDSYSGSDRAPVQTTHSGESGGNRRTDVTEPSVTAASVPAPEIVQQNARNVRERLTQALPNDESSSDGSRSRLSSPPKTSQENISEASRQPEPSQPPVLQTGNVQSPEGEASEGERSPIRVAMPVARGGENDYEEVSASKTDRSNEGQQSGLLDNEQQTRNFQDRSSGSPELTPAGGTVAGKPRALVQYDYDKAEDNEIDLKEGQYVTGIEMVDQDWWLGMNTQGEKGLFPSNYVEILENDHQNHAESDNQLSIKYATDPAVAAAPTPPAADYHQKPTAKALFDYEAAEDNELSFPEGAEITQIVSFQQISLFTSLSPPTEGFHHPGQALVADISGISLGISRR